MTNKNQLCMCDDKGCPVHKGKHCEIVSRTRQYYRIDMQDKTGTAMCSGCADDAMDSGLFSTASSY